jgi:hypothetical protein
MVFMAPTSRTSACQVSIAIATIAELCDPADQSSFTRHAARKFAAWVHDRFFAKPAQGDRFRGPRTYPACQVYFDRLACLLKEEKLVISANAEQVELLDGFVVIRKANADDCKNGRQPLYVLELPQCTDSKGNHAKVCRSPSCDAHLMMMVLFGAP